ncbi:MAG: hypothetical protein K5784_08900 [Clostridiales bacterium]|nr:hypothetical protein [Clostridiales bacterium]
MLTITDNIISLNRGDDVSFTVSIADEFGEPYALEPGDTLVFSVRAEPSESSPQLIRVESVTDTVFLTHADTAALPVGKYSAAVRLNRACGQTLIVFPPLKRHGRLTPWNNFILDPEVTV